MPILFEGKQSVLVVGRNITTRKKADNTIKHLAYFDTLTDLPNRNSCLKHLNSRLQCTEIESMAVLFLDVDQFKRINDTKGHSTGDLILKKVANRLKTAVDAEDFVSRLGGDEFLILLENKNSKEIKEKLNRIMREFSHPIIINQEEFFVTPSIGISIYPSDGQDQESLIKNADAAMYLAKENGKNNYKFYSNSLAAKSSRKMELEMALRKAIQFKELQLHYQPQVNINSGQIVGVEALIRWFHPKYGFVSPNEFVPLAEETNLILSIGDWVIKEACAQKKKWEKNGLTHLKLAINISVRQFQRDEFIQVLQQQVKRFKLNPGLIELEITESIMQNIESSIMILHELKSLGFKISIDDFGKGYSSLSYLKYLPINTIKIDKSFVDDIEHPIHQGSLVKAIIDMGQNMNFSVIAEGIETKEQMEFLQKHNCLFGQGYYFSKPLPSQDVDKLLVK
jgi:diguanylate cyclase (GGDEF)-like protein